MNKDSFDVWSDCVATVNFDLLQVNVTSTADIYCQQLEYLNSSLKEKRLSLIACKHVVFYHEPYRKDQI